LTGWINGPRNRKSKPLGEPLIGRVAQVKIRGIFAFGSGERPADQAHFDALRQTTAALRRLGNTPDYQDNLRASLPTVTAFPYVILDQHGAIVLKRAASPD
jgi:hypothetical protein